MRCDKCGQLKPHFAAGITENGEPRADSGKCLSCRQSKRPGAQVSWQGDVKSVLVVLNSRKNRKRVKA